jgi:hypothetical protein
VYVILKNIRKVIPQHGKLLDLNRLVIPGGRECTAEEYDTLFAGAGFKLERIVPTASTCASRKAGRPDGLLNAATDCPYGGSRLLALASGHM